MRKKPSELTDAEAKAEGKQLRDEFRTADCIAAPLFCQQLAETKSDHVADCDSLQLLYLRAHAAGTNLRAEENSHFDTCPRCREWRNEFLVLSPEAASILILVYEMDAAATCKK